MRTSGATTPGAVHSDDLAALAMMPGPVASAYIGTDAQVENAAQRDILHWRSLRTKLESEGAPDSVLAAIDALIPDAHLHGLGLAVFAGDDGLRHIEHMAERPRADLAGWAPIPSLLGVVEARQGAVPHVIVKADREGADLTAVSVSGAERRDESGGADWPLRKVDGGGWSQRRYQQRAENTWDKNAGDTAEHLSRLVEQVKARLVVLAGDVRALQLLRDNLPSDFDPEIREVEGGRSRDGSEQQMLAEIDRMVATIGAAETVATLEKFREELGQRDRACEGADATLSALARSQVDVLLVHDNALDLRTAWFGPEAGQCALDLSDVRAMGVDQPGQARLVDVAVRAALGTGAGIRVVPKAGGPAETLGAILRWS